MSHFKYSVTVVLVYHDVSSFRVSGRMPGWEESTISLEIASLSKRLRLPAACTTTIKRGNETAFVKRFQPRKCFTHRALVFFSAKNFPKEKQLPILSKPCSVNSVHQGYRYNSVHSGERNRFQESTITFYFDSFLARNKPYKNTLNLLLISGMSTRLMLRVALILFVFSILILILFWSVFFTLGCTRSK